MNHEIISITLDCENCRVRFQKWRALVKEVSSSNVKEEESEKGKEVEKGVKKKEEEIIDRKKEFGTFEIPKGKTWYPFMRCTKNRDERFEIVE